MTEMQYVVKTPNIIQIGRMSYPIPEAEYLIEIGRGELRMDSMGIARVINEHMNAGKTEYEAREGIQLKIQVHYGYSYNEYKWVSLNDIIIYQFSDN